MVPTPVPVVDGSDPGLRLQLLILAGGDRWQAQLTTPGGERLQFDSPFELVRYLAQLARQPAAARAPPGLR